MKKILGILGLILGAVAVYFGIMFAPEIKGAFLGDNPETPTQDVEEPGEPTGDVVTDIVDSDMLKLTKRNKVSANGTALSVTATLSPDYIVDKTVRWSIAWKTTNSANVNDYITLTPSTDTLTCTVAVKTAFTTQIILTCTANSNDSVKATCTIDYVDRSIDPKNNSVYSVDMSSTDPFDVSLEDVILTALGSSWNQSSFYTTKGGSLDGVVKNVRLNSLYFDTDTPLTYNSQSLQNDLGSVIELITEEQTGNLAETLNILESSTNEIHVIADIYYGDTLIKSDVFCAFSLSIINVNTSCFVADGLTLNDTQLIF